MNQENNQKGRMDGWNRSTSGKLFKLNNEGGEIEIKITRIRRGKLKKRKKNGKVGKYTKTSQKKKNQENGRMEIYIKKLEDQETKSGERRKYRNRKYAKKKNIETEELDERKNGRMEQKESCLNLILKHEK